MSFIVVVIESPCGIPSRYYVIPIVELLFIVVPHVMLLPVCVCLFSVVVVLSQFVVVIVHPCCSYFVVDRAELQGKHIKEISMGFYAAGTSQTQKKHFSLNIGQIKVRCLLVHQESIKACLWFDDISLTTRKGMALPFKENTE